MALVYDSYNITIKKTDVLSSGLPYIVLRQAYSVQKHRDKYIALLKLRAMEKEMEDLERIVFAL